MFDIFLICNIGFAAWKIFVFLICNIRFAALDILVTLGISIQPRIIYGDSAVLHILTVLVRWIALGPILQYGCYECSWSHWRPDIGIVGLHLTLRCENVASISFMEGQILSSPLTPF